MQPLKIFGRTWTFLVALFGLIACTSPNGAGENPEFGPSDAEEEIRDAFDLTGHLPTIDRLIQQAEARGMRHEPRVYDRSLRHCRLDHSNRDLNMEIFYAGMDARRSATRNYVAVYDSRRQVLCIETRHAYLEL